MTRVDAALVDTDVFSVLYLRRGSVDPRADRWGRLLTGKRVLISFQTRAEVLAGARMAGWGDRRMADAVRLLDATPTIRPDNDVIDAYATLVADCRRLGHGLQSKHHAGDRWIAACAIAKGLGVLAGDGVFTDAPALNLLR